MRRKLVRGGAAAVLGLAFGAAGACSDDRTGFNQSGGSFVVDASTSDVGCPLQCSLDGRAVMRSCTGEVVEACAPELACGDARCQGQCSAAAANRSSNGCEFYFQIPRFTANFPQSCYAAFIVNTSTLPLDVSLDLEGKNIDVSKAMFLTNPGDATLIPHVGPIAPGESAILFVSDRSNPDVPRPNEGVERIGCPEGVVPAVYEDAPLPPGSGLGSSFHLTTNAPVGLTTIYPFGGASSWLPSATLVLPVTAWAKENLIVNGWQVGMSGVPSAQLFASEDGTEVTLLPTHDIAGGNGVKSAPAKVPVTYRLDKGQLLQLVQDEELSGSVVSSTKPISIVGGNSCANIPTGTTIACDVLAQQLPAFEQWGSEYVGVGYRPRAGDEGEAMPYRIVAARDGTRLDYDPVVPPGAPLTLSAGEVATFYSGAGEPFVVRTQDVDHPIYLAAFMTGSGVSSAGGVGDPEFVNVVPAGQYLSSYSFYADPTYKETSLVVVRAKDGGQFKDVWLECAGNVSSFRPVGTRGEYEFARVDLARNHGPGDTFGTSVCRTGLQRMRSNGPFTATLWGWDYYASYAYPGGMAQRKLVLTPLVPIR